jgi:hypothetical protein
MAYHGAGIIPFCNNHPQSKNGEKWYLLIHETRIDSLTNEIQQNALIDMGGKREFHDTGPPFTAVREMNEESKNMYQDMSAYIIKQIRSDQYPHFVMGNKQYHFFIVNVPYREIPAKSANLEWISQTRLLAIKNDWSETCPVSMRLVSILLRSGVKQRIATC